MDTQKMHQEEFEEVNNRSEATHSLSALGNKVLSFDWGIIGLSLLFLSVIVLDNLTRKPGNHN